MIQVGCGCRKCTANILSDNPTKTYLLIMPTGECLLACQHRFNQQTSVSNDWHQGVLKVCYEKNCYQPNILNIYLQR